MTCQLVKLSTSDATSGPMMKIINPSRLGSRNSAAVMRLPLPRRRRRPTAETVAAARDGVASSWLADTVGRLLRGEVLNGLQHFARRLCSSISERGILHEQCRDGGPVRRCGKGLSRLDRGVQRVAGAGHIHGGDIEPVILKSDARRKGAAGPGEVLLRVRSGHDLDGLP